MRSLLPSDRFGPFVSLLDLSFRSTAGFASCGFILLFGFAAAIEVLSIPDFYRTEDDNGGDEGSEDDNGGGEGSEDDNGGGEGSEDDNGGGSKFGYYSMLRGSQAMFQACFANFDEVVSSIFSCNPRCSTVCGMQ